MKPGLMPTALAMFLTALLAIGAQATMTTVNPLASKAKQNVRSTKVAAGEAETHLLVYKEEHVGSDFTGVPKMVADAGGVFVAMYGEIGVGIATAKDLSFGSKLVAADSRLHAVAATSAHGIKGGTDRIRPKKVTRPAAAARAATATPATSSGRPVPSGNWGDDLSYQQWDMRQINVPRAYAHNIRGAGVKVGILDTGLDYNHPDLTDQIDYASSVSCVSGSPNSTKQSWQDPDGHGTWCSGCMVAAANGIGIVGVAPEAKIVAVRVATDAGYFYPAATVCAFMHAAKVGIDVTSNSYYTDPYLYNCKYDPIQDAIYIAESRAIAYAISHNVVVVAAAGNENVDLQTVSTDDTSPDDVTMIGNVTVPLGYAGPLLERSINSSCIQIPNELPNVISVAAVGVNKIKAYFSNYASKPFKYVQIAAPGGSYIDQFNAPADYGAMHGQVLGTYRMDYDYADIIETGAGQGNGHYEYLQGTSMACPHVAGTVALIISQAKAVGRTLTLAQILAALQDTAQPLSCPVVEPYVPYGIVNFTTGATGPVNDYEADCTTDAADEYTSFYGAGLVDAYAAPTSIKALPKPHPKPHPPPHRKPHPKPHHKPHKPPPPPPKKNCKKVAEKICRTVKSGNHHKKICYTEHVTKCTFVKGR